MQKKSHLGYSLSLVARLLIYLYLRLWQQTEIPLYHLFFI
nr:MAG TPA: hypothetical protein [Caudoviricetes sp.]